MMGMCKECGQEIYQGWKKMTEKELMWRIRNCLIGINVWLFFIATAICGISLYAIIK